MNETAHPNLPKHEKTIPDFGVFTQPRDLPAIQKRTKNGGFRKNPPLAQCGTVRQQCAPNIPNRCNRKQRFGFSPWLYRQRNLVERFFNRIKQFRGIATRYAWCPENYLAAVQLICTRIWCLL